MKKRKIIDLINLILLPVLFFNFALIFYAPEFTLFLLVYRSFGPTLGWVVIILSFIYLILLIIFTFKKIFEQKHYYPKTARIMLIAVFISTYLILLYSILFDSLKPDDYSLLKNNTQFMLVQAGIIIVSIALAYLIIKKIDFEKHIIKVLVALFVVSILGYYGFWLIGVILSTTDMSLIIGVILSAINISLIIFSVLALIIPIIFSYIILKFHRFIKENSTLGFIIIYYLVNIMLFFVIAFVMALFYLLTRS